MVLKTIVKLICFQTLLGTAYADLKPVDVKTTTDIKQPDPSLETPSKEHIKDTTPSGTSQVNMTSYRNGYVLAMRRFTLNLKAGKQAIRFDHAPKTLHMPSIIPSFEGETDQLEIISQTLLDEGSTVIFDMLSGHEQTKTMHLRYMFGGLNWDVSYVGIISPDHTTLSLKGWIEIENNTGSDIRHAQILFNGGNARISPEQSNTEENSSEFTYIMPRPVDLPSGQKSYLSFISKSSIPLKQDHIVYVGGEYLYDLKSTLQNPEVVRVVEFRNDEIHGFQHTLPQGKVTLYQAHTHGMDELLGTMRIQEKVIGQPVPLQVSTENAPSPVSCELEQTDYKKLLGTSSESGYRLLLTNKNDAPVSVRVIMNLPECDWNVMRTSLSYDTHSKRQFSWTVQVPSGQSVELKYRIKLENTK